jgi:hydrogenase maturation factor HypE
MCGTAAHTSFVHFETQLGYLDTGITLSEAGTGSQATGDRYKQQEIVLKVRMRGKSASKLAPSQLAPVMNQRLGDGTK